MPRRRCLQCSELLSPDARADARYCGPRCRSAHWHRRVRLSRRFACKARCEICHKAIGLKARTDARYCSAACRQKGYRARKARKPRKAHQRGVKERLAGAAPVLDISRAEVRPITLAEAKARIEIFEPMPAVSRFAFGIFFDDRCGGAVVYGDEYGENLGVWDRYGYGGQVIGLLRGACEHWAHPHSASKLIRRSMNLLPERYKVVTATVDRAVGEIGTIYQACGFDYVGVMRGGGRALVSINGKRMSERQAGRLAGTQGALALAQLGFDATTRPRPGRYFAFRGSRKERRQLRAAIAERIKPYPKRT
jgi:hypothetical protein